MQAFGLQTLRVRLLKGLIPTDRHKQELQLLLSSLFRSFSTAVRIHIWLERWWKKKRRRTMTCLLHIRTTTAASPNTKRKERSEDLEECITVAMILSLKFPLFFNVYS